MKMAKKLLSGIIALAMIMSSGIPAMAETDSNVIYVSVATGDDNNLGTLAAPLKTIDAAREKARSIDGHVTVEIMGGEYRLNNEIIFTAEDSNVTYKAYNGEKPVIKGSKWISPSTVKKVTAENTAEEIFNKMTEGAKDNAYVIDLAAAGISKSMIMDPTKANTQYGVVYGYEFNGFYIDDVMQTVSQWPNNRDYAQFSKVNDKTSIIYKEDTCDKWADETGWWVGMWMPFDFSYFKFAGVSIDKENNILKYIDNPATSYDTYQYSKRWKAYNLISEMDVPGEYYIDRDNMKLYFYSPKTITNQKLELDKNFARVININGAENITFEGLTFAQSNGSCFSVSDVKNVDIKNCTFKEIGRTAVGFGSSQLCETGTYYTGNDGNQVENWQKQGKNGSFNVDISGNTFNNIGGTAISINGAGNNDTLTPSNNKIENNIISNIGYKSVHPAISIGGCGVTVRNNNISKATIGAIYVTGGNEHLVEKNEIYNVMTEVSDWGAFYEGGSEVFRGTEVNYNYIHDLVPDTNKTYEKLSNAKVAIYFDENQQGLSAQNNIIKNAPIAFNSNHAGNFTYKYNTTVDSERQFSLHDHPTENGKTVKTGALGLTLAQVKELVNDNQLFYTEYPSLKEFVDDGTNPMSWSVLEGNLKINSGDKIGEQAARFSKLSDNNEVTDYNVFVNPDAQDYRLKADAEIAASMPNILNAKNFNIEEIGIQTDFELNEETASFANIFPADGSNIGYQEELNFSWEPALGANNYKLTVATDKNFDNVVFEKTTMQTGAVVTGLEDKNVYYYKVEAENISRELGTTWLGEDGVVEFGINALRFDDTETPEKPANLITGTDIAGNNTNWSGQNIPAELKAGAGYPFKISMAADRLTGEDANYYASGIFLKDRTSDSHFKPNANTNYVFSVKARSVEGNAKVGLANVKYWGKQYVRANHPAEGIQLGKDWTEFKTTLSTVDNSAYEFNYVMFGIVIGEADDYVVYDGNTMYMAEEIEYSMNIEGDEKLRVGENKTYKAEILNQLGVKGALSQDFDWVVVSADRKEKVDGIKVTENADGTITATGMTAGDYVLIAKTANGFVKGINVKVVADYNDTESPEKPENLITGSDIALNNTDWSGQNIPDELKEGAGYPIKIAMSSDRLEGVENNYYASGIFLKDRNKSGTTAREKAFNPKANTTYAFSVKARSVEGNVKVGLSNVDTYYKYVIGNHDKAGIQVGTEWADIKSTLTTVDNTAYDYNYVMFGIVTGKASDYIIYDASTMYMAEEIAYSMNITGDSEMMIGEGKTYSAEILNQVGLKGNLSQEFEWTVLNADRTQTVDGLKVTENEDGTVTVRGVKGGTYTLMASSEAYDFIKGIEVDITSADDTLSPEKPANLTEGGAIAGNNAQWTGSGIPDSMKEGSNWAIRIYMGSDRLEGVDPNYYATGIFLKDKAAGGYFKPKANTNYAFSIKARSVEGNVKVGLANTDTYNKYVIGNHDQAGIQVGTDWTNINTTLSTVDNTEYDQNFVMFGIVTGKASDYIVYHVPSLYIAEEIAYSMNIQGDSRIAVGEEKIYSAELLNQLGIKGALSQDFEWAALNEERDSLADGIAVSENADGTVTVEGLEEGTYTLLAMSEDGFVKGMKVKVIADYNDTETPQKPSNMMTIGANGDGNGIGSNDANWYGGNGKSTCVVDEGRSGVATLWKATADNKVKTWYAAGPFGIDPAKATGMQNLSAGKSYVFSVWAKDVSEENVTAPIVFTAGFGVSTNIKYSNEYPKGTHLTVGKDWTEFAATYTLPEDYAGSKTLWMGYPSGVQAYAGQAFLVDDFYFAEEIAYSMTITGDSTIEADVEKTYSAELLNQIGTKGALSQDFEWMILNEDRTAKADGVELVENEDGTVTVVALEEGTYTLLAISEDDFIKGYTVTVTAGEEPVEKIASAVFEKSGTSVNFKATVENTDAENVFFVIGEFDGSNLVQEAKSVVKSASDANCDLTLENVTVGNTVRAFIWNNGTLLPIDNVDNLALEYAITQ